MGDSGGDGFRVGYIKNGKIIQILRWIKGTPVRRKHMKGLEM